MNRARRKNNRIGIGKRLTKDSLILSCTDSMSSRVVRVFEKGFFSPLLTSVKNVDHFVREKVTGPVFQKLELRKNFTKPARNAVSSFILNNSLFQRMSALRTKFMNTSLRSVGIFLLTFGIYAAAIFLLKNYVSLSVGDGDIDDLIVSALAMIGGVLLTAFGDKSIIYSLANGVITGRLLSGVLGINDTTLDKASPKKAKTSVGVSFLMGSLLGVLTMFFSTFQVMFALTSVIVAVAIFNIPEFGLMLTAVSVAVIPAEQLSVLAWMTLASYLLKCVRLKRNLRFGTADAVILIAFLLMLVGFISTGMSFTKGEQYILCFTALYFPVKNMVVSKKLLSQAFNSLAMGVFLGMLAYILGEFTPIMPYSQLMLLSKAASVNSLDADMLAVMVTAVLPFAFYSFSPKVPKKRDFLFVLVAIGCAFTADSLVFYGMIMLSLFVYIAVAYKAPVGAFFGGAFTIPLALWVLSRFTLSNSVSLFYAQGYDASLASDSTAVTFWEGFFDNCGIGVAFVLLVSVPFVLQRIFASVLFAEEQGNRILFGAIGASVSVLLLMSFMFNLFADVRMICLIWFISGLCGSAYKVYGTQKISREVYGDAKA